jgi:hypothetical protein
MCDYSLCGLPTRLANEGEELVIHKFNNGILGLVSPADLCLSKSREKANQKRSLWAKFVQLFEIEPGRDPATVVCMPPGARLMMRDIPTPLQRRWDLREEEEVVFCQLSARTYSHRDAIRLKSGREVVLQCLHVEIRFDVLSLGETPITRETRSAIHVS